jgi:ABC-type multidrug transport system ATPase subunit
MLTIENLTKTYDNGVQALRGVSLTIPRGIFGLLGPNGAGKSTLMRTLATLQQADAGSCTLGDLDVLREPHRVRQVLGYLPQDFGVYPRVSAEMLLTHLATLKGIVHSRDRAEIVRELLIRTRLWEVRKRRLTTYSGGMRRRFGIAQALLGDPKLLIVDEPTAGLDPEERHRFLNLLSEVGEQVVVILSTHIAEDVRQTCGQMAILVGGRVLRDGDPRELVRELEGQIWQHTVSKGDERSTVAGREEPKSAALGDEPLVLSERLVGGHRERRVFSREHPGSDFLAVPPDLEDVYFRSLQALG